MAQTFDAGTKAMCSTRGLTMATDYDAPRRTEADEVSEDSLEELTARRNEAQSAVVDVDETCLLYTSPSPRDRG